MKKILTLLVIVGLATMLQAQSLPNGSLETWQDFTVGSITFQQPESWNTPNAFTAMAGVTVVTRSTDAYDGTYSARLETKNVIMQFVAPGLITLATFNVNLTTFEYSFSNGLALSEKVNTLTGMYKYQGAQNDSSSLLIYCYRKDGDTYDTIGMGYSFLHDAADWTPFELTMNYFNDHQPDTFNVLIMSSGAASLNPGSVMFVDSLRINTNVGIINPETPRLAVNSFPNPTSDKITFEVAQASSDRVLTFYDIQGKKLGEVSFPSTSLEVNLKGYPSGTLLYRIVDPKNGMATGSVVKN
ncbi:MAG: T9SS type A sorting domain-containing protein [Bacteroidales bacterium]|nr:T9SS type A sorting domain-containing protein [Bacteroidales bacterium]